MGTSARRGFAIAYDLLGNRAEAEEAVQEALAIACEAIDDVRDPAEIRRAPWTAARRLLDEAQRKRIEAERTK